MVITIACYLLMGLVTVVYCLLAVFPLAIAVLFCGFSRKRIGNIMRFSFSGMAGPSSALRCALLPGLNSRTVRLNRTAEFSSAITVPRLIRFSYPLLQCGVLPRRLSTAGPCACPVFRFFCRDRGVSRHYFDELRAGERACRVSVGTACAAVRLSRRNAFPGAVR